MQDPRDAPAIDTRLPLDGNAAAGLLGAVFPFEMTLARATCDGCANEYEVAELVAYTHTPGLVLRCPNCDAVMIRVAQIENQYWLDLRGTTTLVLIDQ